MGSFVNVTINGIPRFANQQLLSALGSAAAPSQAFAVDPATGWYLNTLGVIRGTINGTPMFSLFSTGLTLHTDNVLGWSPDVVAANPDVILARDAPAQLALRNGVNGQAFNVYNTWTDASNYERLEVGWASNVLNIELVAAGTGTLRGMNLCAAAGSIGFYGTTPTAQLTGVAVSAAGIHAALVTLGLITA